MRRAVGLDEMIGGGRGFLFLEVFLEEAFGVVVGEEGFEVYVL